MKRILFALSMVFVIVLSGCNSNKAEPINVTETEAELQGQEAPVPTDITTEASEAAEMPTEAPASTDMTAEPSEPAELPAEDYDSMDNGSSLALSAANQEITNIFHILPSEFQISGAGAWHSILTINDDGTFVGEYWDSNMGITGPGYSNGSVSLCNYSGQFTAPQKISEYVYSMKVESLAFEQAPGTEYFEDDVRYFVTDGLDPTSEFRIYLPGCPLEDVSFPELALVDTSESYVVGLYTGVDTKIRQTIPSGVYVICNLSGTEGFRAEDDDCLWNRTYKYKYGSCRSELWPSYYAMSKLVFWPESGAAALVLEFAWSDDTQRQFTATDSNGSGEYSLTLDFSDDFHSAVVTVESMSGFDLEPWGGTADGTLSAEYPMQ